MMKPNKLTTACAAALLALGLAACSSDDGPTPMDDSSAPTPVSVDLAMLTAGYMATADTFTIPAGGKKDHGDIAFMCAAGGEDCMVEVMVDSHGVVSAMSTGGTVRAMDTELRMTKIALAGARQALTDERMQATVADRRATAMATAMAIAPGSMLRPILLTISTAA